MELRFDGQVVAVSGAGHGLGQAIAESFAALGARVFGCNPVAATVAGARREASTRPTLGAPVRSGQRNNLHDHQSCL